MKNVITQLRSLLIAAAMLAAAVISAPPSVVASTVTPAQSYSPKTATDAIFFSHGFVEALAEGEDMYLRGLAEATAQGESVLNVTNRVSFTLMAHNNMSVISALFNPYRPNQYSTMIAYLSGRVEAFKALAVKYGEEE